LGRGRTTRQLRSISVGKKGTTTEAGKRRHGYSEYYVLTGKKNYMVPGQVGRNRGREERPSSVWGGEGSIHLLRKKTRALVEKG